MLQTHTLARPLGDVTGALTLVANILGGYTTPSAMLLLVKHLRSQNFKVLEFGSTQYFMGWATEGQRPKVTHGNEPMAANTC